MNKKMLWAVLVLAAFLWLGIHGTGYADTPLDGVAGVSSQVQNFFNGAAGFLVKTVGSGVFILGLVVAGIKIAGGDQGGLRNAVMVMIGGAIIFLAKPIVDILTGIAGSR